MSREFYEEKYKNYSRENSLKGWALHLWLVLVSVMYPDKTWQIVDRETHLEKDQEES